MPNKMPVITMQLSSMAQEIGCMLNDYNKEITKYTEESVKNFCTPENLQKIIDDQVRGSIRSAIQESVERYYVYGDGRKDIENLVIETLGKPITEL